MSWALPQTTKLNPWGKDHYPKTDTWIKESWEVFFWSIVKENHLYNMNFNTIQNVMIVFVGKLIQIEGESIKNTET